MTAKIIPFPRAKEPPYSQLSMPSRIGMLLGTIVHDIAMDKFAPDCLFLVCGTLNDPKLREWHYHYYGFDKAKLDTALTKVRHDIEQRGDT